MLCVAHAALAHSGVGHRAFVVAGPQPRPGALHVPVAAFARLAVLARLREVVVDQPRGHRLAQRIGHCGEHVPAVLQRGHAHLGGAQRRRDLVQRQAVGARRGQAQRGREHVGGNVLDQAAVVVPHGALGQCGRDLARVDVADVVDVGLQRGLLHRIGAQPVRQVLERRLGAHGLERQLGREQAAPHVAQAVVVPGGGDAAVAFVAPVPLGLAGIQAAGQRQRFGGHAFGRDVGRLAQAAAHQGCEPRRGLPGGGHGLQHRDVRGQRSVHQGVVQPFSRHVGDGVAVVLHGAQPVAAGLGHRRVGLVIGRLALR